MTAQPFEVLAEMLDQLVDHDSVLGAFRCGSEIWVVHSGQEDKLERITRLLALGCHHVGWLYSDKLDDRRSCLSGFVSANLSFEDGLAMIQVFKAVRRVHVGELGGTVYDCPIPTEFD
jgi:hypothetical protein